MTTLLNRIKKSVFKITITVTVLWCVLTLLLVVPFRWLNPPITMVMAERYFTGDDNYAIQQDWRDWAHMPKSVALAVVASEDQKFPTHVGFDFKAIWSVLTSEQQTMRGASTISQQVAKNMYLWTKRSWFRKGLEVWFTVAIELLWSKQRILEVYLNIAEWGEGVFGVAAASHYHFKKPASQLTKMEAALLAVTLPSPLKYTPSQPTAYLRYRAKWNMTQQAQLGGVSWLAPLEVEK